MSISASRSSRLFLDYPDTFSRLSRHFLDCPETFQFIRTLCIAWDTQTTIVDHPWVAFFPHQSKAQLAMVSVKKSQNLQRGEMRNILNIWIFINQNVQRGEMRNILNIWIFINQNVQRGEMRNEKCTFDPGSDMIHWRQNVTFFWHGLYFAFSPSTYYNLLEST